VNEIGFRKRASCNLKALSDNIFGKLQPLESEQLLMKCGLLCFSAEFGTFISARAIVMFDLLICFVFALRNTSLKQCNKVGKGFLLIANLLLAWSLLKPAYWMHREEKALSDVSFGLTLASIATLRMPFRYHRHSNTNSNK
jgi:hypothetical protein